jgi:RimJ/RimL family protein N-acetyltransferase
MTYGIRRTTDPADVARQTDKHMHKLLCFWPDDWVKSPDNYSIVDDHGNISLLDYVQEGIYEVHIYYEDTGAEAFARAAAMLDWIFRETPARLLVGKTPVLERAAWYFARKLGFKRVAVIDTEWGPMYMSTMSKEQWHGIQTQAAP